MASAAFFCLCQSLRNELRANHNLWLWFSVKTAHVIDQAVYDL